MKAVLLSIFVCCLALPALAASQAEDTLRLAYSELASDRAAAALGLPDLIRVLGVKEVGPCYSLLLADSDPDVVAETLAAIKRTPNEVAPNGARQSTRRMLEALMPRVRELCASSDPITIQAAREARTWIRAIIYTSRK